MSRYFQKITLEELQTRTVSYVTIENELPKSVTDDIAKVKFDLENVMFSGTSPLKYPIGYRTLDNGMAALFVSAGGDWQIPVCFVIYFDGKKLRGYVPSKGNIWNQSKKCAFTNDEISHEVLKLSNESELINDVMNRIQPIPEKTETSTSASEFNSKQIKLIKSLRRSYDVDLSKGFYWQIADEMEFDEPGSILICPKDYWDKEQGLFDQHGSAELFLKDQTTANRLGEVCESMYEFDGSRSEFEQIMQDNFPFFEHKIMFTED